MRQQSWEMGSATTNIDEISDAAANRLWNPITILYSKVLNGMFAKTDGQTKIVSDEICNFLTAAGKTIDPTDSSQMAAVLEELKAEILDVSSKTFSFKGYIATLAPSAGSYTLNVGDMWIDSSVMPTTIPVPSSDISVWNGTAWVSATASYTPAVFDTFSNVNDGEGYYWFSGVWKVISTDLSLDYFTLNTSTGKWEIKSNVNLPGAPTTANPPPGDISTRLATTSFVNDVASVARERCGSIIIWSGNTAPAGTMVCNGAQVSSKDYGDLHAVIANIWGTDVPYYGWTYNDTTYYTLSPTPAANDVLYNEDQTDSGLTVTSYDSTEDTITVSDTNVYDRNTDEDFVLFNLPNFNGKFLQGGTAGSYNAQSAPDIKATASLMGNGSDNTFINVHITTGAFYNVPQSGKDGYTDHYNTNVGYNNLGFRASRSSSVYQNDARLQPDNAEILYVIKY